MMMREERADRLWENIEAGNLLECWPWKRNTKNRPTFRWDGKTATTSRAVYLDFYDIEIPEGYEVDHLCRNERCCNPLHLQAVTKEVNVLRGASGPAINSRKIHCDKGHLLAGDNLEWGGTKARRFRQCVTCRKLGAIGRNARFRAKHREQENERRRMVYATKKGAPVRVGNYRGPRKPALPKDGSGFCHRWEAKP